MLAKILVALIALSSNLACAAPSIPAPPSEGKYNFTGTFRVLLKLQYRVVYGFTDAGKAELEKRLQAGEECANTGREIYLCKSFGAKDGAQEVVAPRVARDLEGKPLELGALRGEPSLISQGSDVSEYQVPQKAAFAGKTYDSYRLVNAQGNWSIRFGEQTEAQFNIHDGALSLVFDESVTLSREAYDVYPVEAAFAR